MSYLHCLSLFAYSGVQHILCCGFGGGFFLLVCLRFVYSMMPVSLDCPFIEHPILEYTLYYSFVLDTADIVFRYMLVFLYFILYFVVFY
jgi:hypothetical protein